MPISAVAQRVARMRAAGMRSPPPALPAKPVVSAKVDTGRNLKNRAPLGGALARGPRRKENKAEAFDMHSRYFYKQGKL